MLPGSKDEHGLVSTLLSDLHIGPVHGAHDQASAHHELHVGGSRGFSARGGDVLRNVRSRDDRLRKDGSDGSSRWTMKVCSTC